MAGLTHNGTKVSVASNKLPSGYAKPTVTEFTDYETVYENRTFNIAKSTVENATATTTMDAIVSALNTAIEALITADFNIGTLTVSSWADLQTLSNNFTVSGVQFTDAVINYVCTVDVYIKTA